jgi:hypothetical protein
VVRRLLLTESVFQTGNRNCYTIRAMPKCVIERNLPANVVSEVAAIIDPTTAE